MSEVYKYEVEVARGVPTILKLFYAGGGTVGIYYSIMLENYLSLGGWVLAMACLLAYHIMEAAAVGYHNQYQLLKTLYQINVLEEKGTKVKVDSLTTGTDENEDETSTD